jgi:hypothetical protein
MINVLSVAIRGYLGGTTLSSAVDGFLGNITQDAANRRRFGTGGKLRLEQPDKDIVQYHTSKVKYDEFEDILLLLI